MEISFPFDAQANVPVGRQAVLFACSLGRRRRSALHGRFEAAEQRGMAKPPKKILLKKWLYDQNKENVPLLPRPSEPRRSHPRTVARKPLTPIRIENTTTGSVSAKEEMKAPSPVACASSSPTSVPKRGRGRPRKSSPHVTSTRPSAEKDRKTLFAPCSPKPRLAKLKAKEHLDEDDKGASASSDYDDAEEEKLRLAGRKGSYRRTKRSKNSRSRSQTEQFDSDRISIDTKEIIALINNEETRESVVEKTGFSPNYVMKLQRKVLRASPGIRVLPVFMTHGNVCLDLQPRPRHEHSIQGHVLHVLYGTDGVPMFICKELSQILGVSDTSLSYWRKKVNVDDTETSQDFRLMYGLLYCKKAQMADSHPFEQGPMPRDLQGTSNIHCEHFYHRHSLFSTVDYFIFFSCFLPNRSWR